MMKLTVALFAGALALSTCALADDLPTPLGLDIATISTAPASLDASNGEVVAESTRQTMMRLLVKLNSQQQQLNQMRGRLEVLEHQVSGLTGKPVEGTNAKAELKTEVAAPMPAVKAAELTPAASAPDKAKSEEEALYQSAFNLLQDRDYSKATNDFQSYLSQFPTGKYAANAHYWLGELYLVSGSEKDASKEFSTVITTFPQHAKVPDAMLKLGYIYYNETEWAKAKVELANLKSKFPNSTAAKLAQERLEQILREGH